MAVLDRYQGLQREVLNTPGASLSAEQLATRSRRCIEMHIMGADDKEIAEALNCPLQTVSQMLNNPLAQAHIKELNLKLETAALEAAHELTCLAPKAVRVINDSLDGTLLLPKRGPDGQPVYDYITGEPEFQVVGPEHRLRVAQDVLDRNPQTAKVSRSQTIEDTSVVDNGVLEAVKERYRKAMSKSEALDAEFTPVDPGTEQPIPREGDDATPAVEVGDNPIEDTP